MLIPSIFGAVGGNFTQNSLPDAAPGMYASGGLTVIPSRLVYSDNGGGGGSVADDDEFFALDLAEFGVPEGATMVLLELGVHSGASPDTVSYLAVRAPGCYFGGFGGLEDVVTGDGSDIRRCESRTGVYVTSEFWVRMSLDYEVELRRVNPNGATRFYRVIMKGWL